MATDMLLSYGGRVQFAANGDLVMVQDTPAEAAATRQRIIFAVLTNPRIVDASGNPISSPDCVDFPDYGAGIRAYVGENLTESVVNGITSRIAQALADDPYVAPNPTISITTGATRKTIIISINANAITGQAIAIPSINLTSLAVAG